MPAADVFPIYAIFDDSFGGGVFERISDMQLPKLTYFIMSFLTNRQASYVSFA